MNGSGEKCSVLWLFMAALMIATLIYGVVKITKKTQKDSE